MESLLLHINLINSANFFCKVFYSNINNFLVRHIKNREFYKKTNQQQIESSKTLFSSVTLKYM